MKQETSICLSPFIKNIRQQLEGGKKPSLKDFMKETWNTAKRFREADKAFYSPSSADRKLIHMVATSMGSLFFIALWEYLRNQGVPLPDPLRTLNGLPLIFLSESGGDDPFDTTGLDDHTKSGLEQIHLNYQSGEISWEEARKLAEKYRNRHGI